MEQHREQPPPQPSKGDMWLEVIKDMEARRQLGITRYGRPVQPRNGRDSLRDLGEELLDAIVYLKQFREEAKMLQLDLRDLRRSLLRRQSVDVEALAMLDSILRANEWLVAEARLEGSTVATKKG